MPRGTATKTLALIDACRAILARIQPASVRAVAYQLFNLKLIPDMGKNSTNKVSRVITRAREQGVIPWDWVVDESRSLEGLPSWGNPEVFACAVSTQYRLDRWAYQPRRVECWSEKGTVRGTLRPVLDHYGVPFRVLHGYSSATVLHEVAEESQGMAEPLLALYCGDWDPSGLHMSEVDLPGRLEQYRANVELVRVALVPLDLTKDLPSFPATDKQRDARYQWFVERHGGRCLELDALDPRVLRRRVEDAIVDQIEADEWERWETAEKAQLSSLREVMGNWAALGRTAQ